MVTTTAAANPQAARVAPALGPRLLSLDLLRGATIAGMILVNNAGNEEAAYWPLQHARWNGWTPTDLVFPFFLFMVGVSMAFSLASRRNRDASRGELIKHILWRGLILFAIGVGLNGFPYHALASWRIYGVLQRIAICYVICALVALYTGKRSQWAIIFSCLVGYWLIMRYLPVPGFGVPTHDMPLLDPDRNIVAWLDRILFPGRLYEITRDPEGVISTIPAVATCLLGLMTGDWLRSERTQRAKAAGMLAMGVIGIIAGEIANIWFPINKKLWTSSFVLLTAGLALVCLALCYWLLDMKQWRSWAKPFLVFGSNAIAAYVFAEIGAHLLFRMKVHLADGTTASWQSVIYERLFAPLGSPANASLLYALVYVGICWMAMWVLYRKRIFLKI
jgi:predicted acyltransferase